MIWFTRIYGIHYDVATWTPPTESFLDDESPRKSRMT